MPHLHQDLIIFKVFLAFIGFSWVFFMVQFRAFFVSSYLLVSGFFPVFFGIGNASQASLRIPPLLRSKVVPQLGWKGGQVKRPILTAAAQL